MRIKKISVKGLFDLFDHEVPLNLDERITLIHGANGLGKTAVLRLLDGVFNSKHSELVAIPFSTFWIFFSDDGYLKVVKSPVEPGEPGLSSNVFAITFEYTNAEGENFVSRHHDSKYDIVLNSVADSTISNYDDYLELFNRMLDLEKSSERSGAESGPSSSWARTLLHDHNSKKEKDDWLKSLRTGTNIHFIESQRLVSISRRKSPHRQGEEQTVIPAVQVYSEEVTKFVNNTLAEYAELSQSLDRTFPERLVRRNPEPNLSSDELRYRLASLEQKRQGLQAAGLLEEERGVGFEMPQQLDATTQNVLSVYVEDVEKKLGVFNTMAEKIDLLRQIVDSRFLYKRMTVDREKGFVFTSDDGQTLSPTHLSSGEQNELVLLYELLFKVRPGSLILIDEPEISLHVAWQQQFLKDLQQIIHLSQFDVLIATHSPQIVHDRWDLTVELQGPQQQRRSK